MKKLTKQLVFLCCTMWLLWTLEGCSKDNDTNPANVENNKIAVVSEGSILVKPGGSVSIDLTFNDPANGAMLVIYRNEGPLMSVPLTAGQTSYTFTDEEIPVDLEEGDTLSYQFFIADQQNTIQSDATEYIVSVALYEQITLGNTSVFSIELPQDGIVEQGTIKLAAGRKYWLPASIYFAAGSSLEIEEGVELYINTESGEIYDVVINEGAMINVHGSASNPVVITSDKVLHGEEANAGDWGQFNIKGQGNGSASGSVAYLRLEYGGDRVFRLEGVGSGTTIQYVQAYRSQGEGIMSTDGDVNMAYVVTTNCEGGGFRFGDAYAGNVQFAIAQSTVYYSDGEAVTVRETASPTLANFTIIGPGTDVDDTHGLRLRGNSAGKVYNTVIADFPRRGLRLNDEVQVTDLNGATVFAYSYIFNVPRDPYRDDAGQGNLFRGYLDTNGIFQNPFYNNVTGFENGDEDEPVLAVIEGIGSTSYVPQTVQESIFDPVELGAFFTNAAFVGAVQDEAHDWTKGWVRDYTGNIHQ